MKRIFFTFIYADLQIYKYGHGKQFQGKTLLKFFFLLPGTQGGGRPQGGRGGKVRKEEGGGDWIGLDWD